MDTRYLTRSKGVQSPVFTILITDFSESKLGEERGRPVEDELQFYVLAYTK